MPDVILVLGVPPAVVVRVDGNLINLRQTGPRIDKVFDEAFDPLISQHTLHLGTEFRVRDRAVAGGELEEPLVRDAPPKESSKASDEFVVVHLLGLLGVRVKQEPGVGKDRHEQVPKNIDFRIGGFQLFANQGIQFLAFTFRQGTPPCLLRESPDSHRDSSVLQFPILHERLDTGRWPLPGQIELDPLDYGITCVLHHFLVDGGLATREVVASAMGWFQPIRLGKILPPSVGPTIVSPNEVGVPKGHPVLVGHGFVRGRVGGEEFWTVRKR